MYLIKPYYEILTPINREQTLKLLELSGRVCYKSEDKITEESASKFCGMILNRNHLSVIEHVSVTVKFIVDRSFSHELIRHRLCSFSQESTRYVNYNKKGIVFIIPLWCDLEPGEYNMPVYYLEQMQYQSENTKRWYQHCYRSEIDYNELIKGGWQPQQARSILPNSLKTEIITTANLREWKHIFELRCDKSAHPQMREIMIPLCKEFQHQLPEIFGEIKNEN